MSSFRQNKIVLYVAYFFMLLIAYLVQYTPMMVKIGGAFPNLILIVTVIAAVNENDYFSSVYGLAAGTLVDVNSQNGIGIHALLYMLTALCCSLFVEILLQKNFLSFIVVLIPTLIFHSISEWLLVSGIDSISVKAYFSFYFASCIYSLIVSVPMYAIIKLLFVKKKKSLMPVGIKPKKLRKKKQPKNTIKDY